MVLLYHRADQAATSSQSGWLLMRAAAKVRGGLIRGRSAGVSMGLILRDVRLAGGFGYRLV
jgi:hypothetical protein